MQLQFEGKDMPLAKILQQEYGLTTKNMFQPLLVSDSGDLLVPE